MNLRSPVAELPFIGPAYAKRLKKLEIETIEQLLWHIPFRYDDYQEIFKLTDFPLDKIGTIKAEVLEFKNQYTKQGKVMQIAEIYDGTGKIYAVWFNQSFLVKTLPPGTKAYFSGKISWWNKKKALYGPDFEIVSDVKPPIHTARLVPVYHETYGISSKWLRSRIYDLLEQLTPQDLPEFLPEKLLQKYNLDSLLHGLKTVHFPNSLDEALLARKRLAFDELLALQLTNMYHRIEWQKNEPSHRLSIKQENTDLFLNSLPFSLTRAQTNAIQEILTDLQKPVPMNRLLEGDVGSGKTVVAAAACYAAIVEGYQSVVMAPTQILAQQHYHTLSKLFKPFGIGVNLITSESNIKSENPTGVFVGTHSLIHKKIDFEKVALVVIDEQHRFGVEQRAHLIDKTAHKTIAPHVLTMTATPIPRTVALTLYGELDLSILDELPKGRQPVTTWVVPPHKRDPAYEWIRGQIQDHQVQVFVVCPLIEESESESLQQVKGATKEYELLKKVFPELKLSLLHGRMPLKEKNEVLDKFRDGKSHILVTTPVVEVGVDIPNATIMLIEAAERFGLAQLHQLRGRVGRGTKQSYCLLFTENQTEKVIKRLNAMKENVSGFQLAEIDLALRGPGEVLGTRQHGYSELKIASWQDVDLIKTTKLVATEVIDNQNEYKDLLKWYKKLQIVDN